MELYGLLGYPLGHSFSASYFHDKFEREGLDADYRNFEFEHVADAVAHFKSLPELCGFNVTIPHKQAIIPLLDELSDEARVIGAVNVVKVEHTADGSVRLLGRNSDLVGFRESIRPLLAPAVHAKALVLGTGGASKAVVHALHQLGLATQYVSRTAKDGCITYEQLTPAVMAEYMVVVNCTPLGMYPKVDAAPAIPYGLLTSHHVLFDLVYNPDVTLFMRKGMEYGAVVKNGLEMLHRQADAAWTMWHE